jgi:hypothetical protein
MEDLTAADQRPWSPSHFATYARHLGEFNGRFLVDGDQPADWWLSRGWLRGWTERSEPMITQLPSLADHPVVAEIFAPSTIGLLLQVWEHRREVYEAIDRTFRTPSVTRTCIPATPSSRRRRYGADGCDRLGVLRLGGPRC